MSKCEACEAEFEKEHPEDELCNKCEEACLEDGQVIILGKYDAAVVLRSEGQKDIEKELFLPVQNPDTYVSDAAYAAAMIAIALDNNEAMEYLVRMFEKSISSYKEKIDEEVFSTEEHEE